MGLAMRLVRYFPMVVLAGFLCEAALPHSARAWDNPTYESPDPSPPAQNSGRIIDESVQQARYLDSRPNPSANSSSDSGKDRNGPLFHGKTMRFPTLPFGRQKPNNAASNQQAQTVSNQGRGMPNNSNQAQPRPGSQPVARRPMQPMQQRAMSATAATNGNSNGNVQTMRSAPSLPPQPLRQQGTPRPVPLATRPAATTPAAPNTTSVSPWKTAPVAAGVAAPVAIAAAAGNAAPPKHAESLSQADRLVAQAHQWSTTAKTDQEFTRIIETCCRAQASPVSRETAKYASNLTAWAYNRRGQLKAEAGHDKEAILDFDDAIRSDATCWRAIHNRGVLLAQAGQFEKAFDDFSSTIQRNPQFAKAFSNRAALFMVANNLNAALRDYKRAIEIDPNLAVAHRGCGRVCQLLGRLDEAIGHCDAAVQLAPGDAYAAACRADLLTDLGRYSDARAEYDRAIELDPKSSQAHCGSAWLLATCPDSSLRNPQLAVEHAKLAIEYGGEKDAISYDSLAAAEASAGNYSAAMQSIRKAIELAPADERSTYNARLALYQHAKPYRIAPVERVAQQANFETR